MLNRKLVRDLWRLRGPACAIAAVMACGIATFVMSLSTLASLSDTLDAYYARYRFAEVFVHVKRAPLDLAERIAEVPGVDRVEPRVVVGVTLLMPDLPEPAVGRLVALQPEERRGLNEIHLRTGRRPEPGREREVVVSEAFANAHALRPGDRVPAIMNGRLEDLEIVGVALSPEFIYQLPEGEIIPDDLRFGVFWMSRKSLEAAFDLEGAFNDLTLTLRHGASEDEVIRRIDRLTEPYGGLGAYGRKDHMSHWFVANEMKELRGMALFAPAIFLAVAVFLLNTVLNRIVGAQREQIGTLKALGFTGGEIGRHFLTLTLLIVMLGVILGIGAGAWLGAGLTRMYATFFHFPIFSFALEPRVVVGAFAVSVAAGVLGAGRAVRSAASLPPAEAMRPAAPVRYGASRVERLGLMRRIGPAARMIVRHLTRHPWKTALSVVGIAMAGALVVLGGFTEDAIDHALDHEFRVQQRQDVTVGFNEPVDAAAVAELAALPGVLAVEPIRALPVRLRAGSRSRRVGILGLTETPDLMRPMDTEARAVELPVEGLVLSDKLAELLGVTAGDSVRVEVLEGERPVRDVVVAALVRQYSGLSAYMRQTSVNRLMREGPRVTGVHLRADADAMDDVYARLRRRPGVAGVTLRTASLDSFRETMGDTMLRIRAINVMFAVIIAVGVVYNTARISLAERARDLATLRVIGFTRGEISAIQLGELGLLTLAAVPLGLILGYGLAGLAVLAFDTELFRVPFVIGPSTYVFSAVVVIVAAIGSGLLVRRRLDHLDLVSVLKTRE